MSRDTQKFKSKGSGQTSQNRPKKETLFGGKRVEFSGIFERASRKKSSGRKFVDLLIFNNVKDASGKLVSERGHTVFASAFSKLGLQSGDCVTMRANGVKVGNVTNLYRPSNIIKGRSAVDASGA